MTYAVAFDASPLARTALGRAGELGEATDEAVVAVTCIPDSTARARENGWVTPGETYDLDGVVDHLRAAVTDVVSAAHFRCETVAGSARKGVVNGTLREAVTEMEPDVVFVGSERAGVATPMESVAGTLLAGGEYDVHLVRDVDPQYVD